MSQPPVNPDQPPYGEQPPYPPTTPWQAPEAYPGQPVSGGPPAAEPPGYEPPGYTPPTAPMPPVPSAPPYQQYPGQAPQPGQYQPGQPYQPGQYQPGQYPPAQPYQPGQPYPGQPAPQAYQPGQPYPGAPYPGGAPVAAKSSNRTLIIVFVVIGALLLLCCIGGVGLFVYRASQLDTTASDSPGITFPDNNNPNDDETVAAPSGDNANQALGKVITFKDSDGTWTVTVTGRTWSDKNCGSSAGFFPPPDGKLLIVDIAFEVTKGTASINPFYFDYLDSAGKRGDYSILSGCDEPALEADNDLPAGTKRTGKIVFDVTVGQTGVIQYENLFGDESASWKITP